VPGGNLGVSFARLRQRVFPRERDDAMQLRIELFQTMQIDFR
jgi:hypothetical protein